MNKPVDLKDLYELSRGNNDFVKEMIMIFLDQNPCDLKELETSISKKDFTAIKGVAHKMKTSLGFMGMKHLLKPLEAIEITAEKKEDLERITELYKEIESGCDNAMNELKKLLVKLDKSIG